MGRRRSMFLQARTTFQAALAAGMSDATRLQLHCARFSCTAHCTAPTGLEHGYVVVKWAEETKKGLEIQAFYVAKMPPQGLQGVQVFR